MDEMGGLRKFMPITFWTFVIGTLALAGIFPLAGFWSKDEILANAGSNGFDTFLVVGLIGALLTAAYMTRCVYLTFFGEYRGHAHPHESEPSITVPLVILAGLSIVAGLINAAPLGIEKFTEYVEPSVAFPDIVHAEFDYPKAILSVSLALLAIGIAAFYWFRHEQVGPLKGLTKRNRLAHAGYTFLENKYYLDHLYENVIVDGIQRPDRRVPRTGSTSTSSTVSSTAPAAAQRSSGGSPTTPSTSASSTERRTASPTRPAWPAKSCAGCRAAGCSGTRCSSSAPWVCSPWRCSSRTRCDAGLDDDDHRPEGRRRPWTGSMTGR